MKTLSLKTGLLALAAVLSLAHLAQANAEPKVTPKAKTSVPSIPDGYFSGKSSRGAEVKIFIQRIERPLRSSNQSGTEQIIYGLILRDKSKEGKSATLFRIEELADGIQNWVELYQNSDNVLSAPSNLDATYTAQAEKKGKRIRLTPTGYGLKQGCDEEMVATKSSKRRWAKIPNNGLELDDSDASVNPKMFTGSFQIDGIVYRGLFNLTEFLPGIYLLRAQVSDPEVAEGKRLEKKITAVVASIYVKKKFIFDSWAADKYQIRLFRLNPGVVQCRFSEKGYEQE